MELTKYLNHLPTCNKRQDWTEAQEALSFSPDGPDKDAAYEEMHTLMNKCTCGVNDAMVRFASSWYIRGWMDTTESGNEIDIRAQFDRNYSDLIHPI